MMNSSDTVFTFLIDKHEEVEDTAELVVGETHEDIVGPMVDICSNYIFFTFDNIQALLKSDKKKKKKRRKVSDTSLEMNIIENMPGHEYSKQSTNKEEHQRQNNSVDEHNYGSGKNKMKYHG